MGFLCLVYVNLIHITILRKLIIKPNETIKLNLVLANYFKITSKNVFFFFWEVLEVKWERQGSCIAVVTENVDYGARWTKFVFLLHHLFPRWSWANYLTSLEHSFLAIEIRATTVFIHRIVWEFNKIIQVKCWETCLDHIDSSIIPGVLIIVVSFYMTLFVIEKKTLLSES